MNVVHKTSIHDCAMMVTGEHWPVAYSEQIRWTSTHGHVRKCRGTTSIEMRPATVRVLDTSCRFAVVPGRGINHCFSIAEAVSILAPHNSVEYLSFYNSNIKKFSKNGSTFEGHYGERIAPRILQRPPWSVLEGADTQLDYVIKELINDPGSRRALLSIWSPHLDAKKDGLDYPCNVMMMFKMTDDLLHAHVIRRSSDLIWGVPHDHVVFTVIQDTVARTIGATTGEMIETSDSLHMYQGLYDDILSACVHASIHGRVWACCNSRPDVDYSKARAICQDIIAFDMEIRKEFPTFFFKIDDMRKKIALEYGSDWWADAFMALMAYHMWKVKNWAGFILALEHVGTGFRSALYSTFEPRVLSRKEEIGEKFVNDFKALTCVCAAHGVSASGDDIEEDSM